MSASSPPAPLPTLLSRALIAFTIELDNEFERRFAAAGGGARVVSFAMWSNVLRFVGDGIAVGELPAATGLPKARLLSTLGGLERWRYVLLGPLDAGGGPPPEAKRDGWGSARGLHSTWVVRPTPAGLRAAAIWPSLPAEVEGRWRTRFGGVAVDELRGSLQALVGRLEVELPEYLPIVGGANGMISELAPLAPRATAAAEASHPHLAALLSRTLLAYTLEFEERSELSLPLSANVVRVLGDEGVPVRDLPALAGVSKEAIAMALTFLTKSGYVAVEGTTAATRRVRPTPRGRDARQGLAALHDGLLERWTSRFGADEVGRLRAALERVSDSRLAAGLEPPPGGWRGTTRYAEGTAAMLEDPIAALPHQPLVLHRGGWPDGS